MDRRYVFSVAFFERRREEQYIYSYDYKKESAWVVYRADLSRDFFSKKSYVFKEDGFFRVCVKKVDGSAIGPDDAESVNDILHFYAAEREFVPKDCFIPEISDTVEKVKAIERAAGADEGGCKSAKELLELVDGGLYAIEFEIEDKSYWGVLIDNGEGEKMNGNSKV